jgi:hypothetical protein
MSSTTMIDFTRLLFRYQHQAKTDRLLILDLMSSNNNGLRYQAEDPWPI